MNPSPQKIVVISHARLHMGFIDLSGSLGRNFGSIGLAINEIYMRLSLQYADTLQVTGKYADRASKCTQELCSQLKVCDKLSLKIDKAIPEHIGLGSGTQMALAIGMALNKYYQLEHSIQDIACLTERGMRSGVGIGLFGQGGLVVDGGRGKNTLTPPVIAQIPVPKDWRFILVFDQRGQGLHSEQEINAFSQLPPFSAQKAAQLCHQILMLALPSVAENNIMAFGEAISALQKSVGEYFAPAQGGVFASAAVAEVMGFLKKQGAVAIGQTSWGPTGFCAVADVNKANILLALVQNKFQHLQALSYQITSPCNRGSKIICK